MDAIVISWINGTYRKVVQCFSPLFFMQLLGHILIHPLLATYHTFKHNAVVEEWNFKCAYEHFLFDLGVW